MALEVNGHVSRLRRFQPFQSDSAELVYEQSDPEEKTFSTKTLQKLMESIEDGHVRLIVLTGDAGHGKTSLCAQVLISLGITAAQASGVIKEKANGTDICAHTRAERPIKILKDLSDYDYAEAARILNGLLTEQDAVSIVCANEGRLRRVVSKYSSTHPELAILTETLENGLIDGSIAGVDRSIEVINLNFQSVAPENTPGLVDWAVRTWGADRRRWQICGRCDAADVCPIFANHRDLADEDLADLRRSAFASVFATAERTGTVVTTRQALAIVTHSISGGLTCSDVHKKWRVGQTDRTWQFPYLYHQALFGSALKKNKSFDLPALSAIKRLDPGKTALREVDDALEPGHDDKGFLPPLPTIGHGAPRSRKEAQRESEVLRELMRFLRRQSFFSDETRRVSMTRRMGLRSGDDFRMAAASDLSNRVEVRDRLLRGLEALQGLQRPGSPPDFLVLDPAFMSHKSRAAVVARRVASRNVRLVSQRLQWEAVHGSEPDLPGALEWLDRVSIVGIELSGQIVPMTLDLLRFELLYRWADGLSSRMQHEAEVRHFTSALSRMVPTGDMADEITILLNGERRTLTIDVGDRLRSGEG